jgi:deoxycytidylate deaminase
MIKPRDPRELAVDLLPRSTCSVQVAAVIADDHGIFSWGWNSPGNGFGEHAEVAAIRRANKDRLTTSSIYVASQRKRNGKVVMSKPCESCMRKISKRGIYLIYYRDAGGTWRLIPAPEEE